VVEFEPGGIVVGSGVKGGHEGMVEGVGVDFVPCSVGRVGEESWLVSYSNIGYFL